MGNSISFLRGFLCVTLSMLATSCLFFIGRGVISLYQTKKIGYPASRLIHVTNGVDFLPSLYLEQLLGFSVDNRSMLKDIDLKWAQKQLLLSPLIKRVHIKKVAPSTLAVEYMLRRPIAYVADYENMGIDAEGYVFPIYPFMAPKNLPEVCMGKWHFTRWDAPVATEEFFLAQSVLEVIGKERVQTVDVSRAYEGSYGRREIVVTLKGKHPLRLRLGTKNYEKGWGCYKQLEASGMLDVSASSIDLRIPDLGFVVL